MTEQEFYKLKVGDEVEYNGDRYKFIWSNINLTTFRGEAKFDDINSRNILPFYIYKNGNIWTNSRTLSDDKTLGNLKLIKSNVPTIDQQIQETKSEIEKLQIELKKLESEKNSKRIEQLISEMVPGKFYTIKYNNSSCSGGEVVKFIRGTKDRITVFLYSIYEFKCVDTYKIKDIIPREDITNDYNNLMEKIKKYNGE